MILAQAGQIGMNIIQGLCATIGCTEAADHFIEDQKGAVLACEPGNRL